MCDIDMEPEDIFNYTKKGLSSRPGYPISFIIASRSTAEEGSKSSSNRKGHKHGYEGRKYKLDMEKAG